MSDQCCCELFFLPFRPQSKGQKSRRLHAAARSFTSFTRLFFQLFQSQIATAKKVGGCMRCCKISEIFFQPLQSQSKGQKTRRLQAAPKSLAHLKTFQSPIMDIQARRRKRLLVQTSISQNHQTSESQAISTRRLNRNYRKS